MPRSGSRIAWLDWLDATEKPKTQVPFDRLWSGFRFVRRDGLAQDERELATKKIDRHKHKARLPKQTGFVGELRSDLG